jgi:hypothetical protein
MTSSDWLIFLGLFLNLAGSIVVVIWGSPQPTFAEGGVLTYGDEDYAARARAQKRRYKRLSRIGMGLIVVGFALQLAAVKPACWVWGCQ